jgi:Bacterial Ig domain/PKD domain
VGCRQLIARAGVISGLVILSLLFSFIPLPLQAETSSVSIGVGDTTFTVNGFTSPSALVTISDSGSVIGTTTAASDGAYSQHFTAQPPGIHSLQVYAQDRAGQTTTPASVEVNITEHAETTVDVFLPPTIQLSTTTVKTGEAISLAGEAAPDTTVHIYIDSTTYASASVDSTGYWRYTLSTVALTVGQHQLFVIAGQSGGNQSYPSAPQSFVISAPATNPIVTQPPALPAPHTPAIPIVVEPKPNSIFTISPITVDGNAEPRVRIEIWDNDTIVGSVFADDRGEWHLTIPLFEGSNAIKTRACTGDLCSDFSPTITVLFRPSGLQELLRLQLKVYSHHIHAGESITLEGIVSHGQKPYTFVIKWGDGTHDIITTSSDAPTFHHRFTTPGAYNGTVTVTDKSGGGAQLFFATQVDTSEIPFWLFGVLLLFVLPLVLLLRRKKRHPEDTGRIST